MNIIKWLLSKLNPEKLFEVIASVLIDVFPGLKSGALGWVSILIGLYNILASPENIAKLCDQGIICLEGNAAWGWVTLIAGTLIKVFSKSRSLRYKAQIDELKNIHAIELRALEQKAGPSKGK